MTMIIEDRATNYDGSPDGDDDIQTAIGSVVVTFSGTKVPVENRNVTMILHSRSDTAEYVNTLTMTAFGRKRVNLASGDEYYFTVHGVKSTDSIDISVVTA